MYQRASGLPTLKLLEATYVGLDGCFTKIKVKIADNGEVKEGFFLFENDGRDFEVEGDLDRQEVFDNMDSLIWDEEPMKLLEKEVAKGKKAYEQQGR